MAFSAGIDLGTTFTAAAINRDGNIEMFRLDSASFTIPSILYFPDSGEMTTGTTARRRLATEPDRVAHEFKRRMGDPAPLMIGGAPFAAHLLTGRLLDWVVDRIEEQEGARPELVTVTHPANWGPFRRELMDQAIKAAEVERAVTITEPEAAAIAYATTREVAPGAVVAVYDLGGGTFDAAILRRTPTGFELIGTPDGVENLGGLDFDAAMFAFVAEQLGGALDELDMEQTSARAAVQRLRDECVEAKIALSTDTDTTIPVILPGVETQVRVTRREFEQRIRPLIEESLGALARTLRSASVKPGELDRVLLVGGSSRIPLVGQMVTAELGRPVAIDADPKNAIARGAAIHAHSELTGENAAQTFAPPLIPPVAPQPTDQTPPETKPVTPPPSVFPAPGPTPVTTPATTTPAPSTPPPPTPPRTPPPSPQRPSSPSSSGGIVDLLKKPAVIGGGVAAVLLLVIGVVVLGGGSGSDEPETTTTTIDERRSITAIEVGDCLALDRRSNVERVDCEEPNLGQVFFIFESKLGPDDRDPYPGAEALFEEAQPTCDAQLDNAQVVEENPEIQFASDTVVPEEDEWVEQNSRRLLCLAVDVSGTIDLSVGNCYNRTVIDALQVNLTQAECVEPFFAEIYARFPSELADEDEYPGVDVLFAEAIPACNEVFEADTGSTAFDLGFVIDPLIPSEVDWDNVVRDISCGQYGSSQIDSFIEGECTTDPFDADGNPAFVEVTPCLDVQDGVLVDIPHGGEVFHIATLAADEEDPFPGNQPIFDEAQPICDEAFESYVGTPLAESSLTTLVISPSESEWEDVGLRSAACLAVPIDGSQLEFPVRDSSL